MPQHPKVFISYSHDSPEHKRWVSRLALALHQNNVDVILDQWDLIPGQEWRQFIEDNVRNSDRILLICTPDYLRKASHGVGGVGIEWQIVTAHLGQDQGVNKFIPIIREPLPKENLTPYLRNLAYIDFTDETQFNEKFDELLNFLNLEVTGQNNLSVEVYQEAVRLAREADLLGWRHLLKRIKPRVFNSLIQWREDELDGKEPDFEKLFKVVDGAVSVISPLISVALVGVESAREEFRDQKSLLHELLNIPDWKPAGYTIWVNIPDALGYVYHSVHGALSLLTGQVDLALNLARAKVPIPDTSMYLRLWETSELRGYAESISGNRGGNCIKSWEYLSTAYERWDWLDRIFGDELEYRTSLVAYYMALHIHELATIIASGNHESLSSDSNPFFDIPLTFVSEGREINQRAISLLLRKPESLSMLWRVLDVTREQMAHSWRNWIHLSEIWLRRVYGPSFRTRVTHQHLFELI